MGHEEIYIGRAPFSGSLTVGRIQPSHRCLYIPYNGLEHRIEHYEVLVYKPRPDMGAWRGGAVKNIKTNQPLIPSLVSHCKNSRADDTRHTSRKCGRRLPRGPQVDNLAINIQSSLNISNTMACMCCGKAISRDKPKRWWSEPNWNLVFRCQFCYFLRLGKFFISKFDKSYLQASLNFEARVISFCEWNENWDFSRISSFSRLDRKFYNYRVN